MAKKKAGAGKPPKLKKDVAAEPVEEDGAMSKMDMVREQLDKNPDAKPAAIAEAIKAAHGIEIATSQINVYKSRIKKAATGGNGAGKGKRGRKAAVAAGATSNFVPEQIEAAAPKRGKPAVVRTTGVLAAFKSARDLLLATGSAAEAKALLDEIEAS